MSYPATLFGRIVTGGDVEEACIASLKLWSSTYIAELERSHGLQAGDLARIRSFTIAPTLDKYPEEQLPALLVISPGLVPPLRREGDSTYSGSWLIDLGVVCSARDADLSRSQARLYLAAHRALLLQRQSLDGFGSSGTGWLGESYDGMTVDDGRSLGWGVARFSVEVQEIQAVYAGPGTPDAPLDPDTGPWPDDPLVEVSQVDLERVPN